MPHERENYSEHFGGGGGRSSAVLRANFLNWIAQQVVRFELQRKAAPINPKASTGVDTVFGISAGRDWIGNRWSSRADGYPTVHGEGLARDVRRAVLRGNEP